MNTSIKKQKYYTDAHGKVFCIDIMQINEETWEEEVESDWRQISADEAMLLANPPPTTEQLTDQVRAKIKALISEAASVIDPLKEALEGEYIDEEDKPKLMAWQKYRYALTKVDPANPSWPDKPE
ncbi:tail fiber assembly protein [Citrobacter braakii]|uniref:tail fiber assembly protein n=1 Tax=Citrobacter braakii TaxID=57706 RepID=UPI0006A94D90|nr:tail assembly chaperone [Citrobacter braakii]